MQPHVYESEVQFPLKKSTSQQYRACTIQTPVAHISSRITVDSYIAKVNHQPSIKQSINDKLSHFASRLYINLDQ